LFSLTENKVRKEKTDLYTCMEEGHTKQGVRKLLKWRDDVRRWISGY